MNTGAKVLLLICVLLMVTMGFNFVDGIAEGASLKNLLLYGMLLWYGKDLMRNKAAATRSIRAVHTAFVILAAWSLVATLLAFGTGVGSYDLLRAVLVWKNEFFDGVAMLLITGMVIRNRQTAFSVLRILLFGITAFAALTIVEVAVPGLHFYGLDSDSGSLVATGRPKGPFGEPNQTAAVLALLVPIAFSLAAPRDSTRSVYLAVGALLVATIMVTGSRGGMAGAAVGCLVLMFLLRKRVGIGGKLAVLLTIPLLAVLVWAIVPVATQVMIQERVGTMVDPTVDARTASAGRTMIWGSALEIWLEQPIFGVGYTGFQQKFHGATHNEYLRYLVDIGIVGFFIFMLLWRRVFACLFLAQDPGMKVSFVRAGAIAGVSGLLVSIFFVNLYKPWLIVWCIIGVLMCYLSYEHTARLRRAERARAERQEGKDEQDERAAEAGVMATK